MPFKYNALLGLGLDNTIPLDGAGKIPSTFLPSYVDDVEEYNNLAAFPATGETGKIYVAIDTGFVYRWSGSVYVQIGITAAAGSTTQVQFNDGGAFGGDSGLTFDKTTDALTAGSLRTTSLGTAAAPSFTIVGDPNTGIYSPGADQLAVSTGGTGRLFISSTGLVGIGTSAPQAKFEVAGDAVIGTDNAGLVEFTSLGVPFFAVAADASNYRSTRINIVSAGGWADLSFDAIGTAPKTGLPSAGSFSGSIMYLDASAQRVGIGSTSPDALLTVNGIGAFGAGAVTTPSIAQTGDLNTGFWFPAADTIAASTAGSERARIDSSGRLLVGTSTAASNVYVKGDFASSAATTPAQQLAVSGSSYNGASIVSYSTKGYAGTLSLSSSKNNTIGTNAIVVNNQAVGVLSFSGNDGTNFIPCAEIKGTVDGTPGADDMPGRLVFSTTADGSASPTERLRITSDGVQAYNQPAPAAVNATATLTVANLKAGIITSTSAAATDMTLPTGTDTQAGFSGTYDNFTFEWSVINTGPSLVRVLAATAHTIVGSGSVATGTSGRFASRRTASNTFVSYRLS
ncbi:tail fiber protein [Synechococcus phage S-LBS1]|nr:tail fiber protein [Synechococcus phage S-LBS1]